MLDIQPPYLMIDSFEIIEKGAKAKALKKLTDADWFFSCHLPKTQIMPATLQIEGMLQTLVLLIYASVEHGDQRAFITDIQVKILSAAVPEQDIEYEAELLSSKRGVSKGTVVGRSLGKVVCKGSFTYASPHLMIVPK